AAALLVLEAAPAGAGIVASDLAGDDRSWLHQAPLGKKPAAVLALELAALMVFSRDAPLFLVAGNELHLAHAVVLASLLGADDFEPLPVGALGPLPGPGMIITLAMVGMGALEDEIHLRATIGRIACPHELFRRFGELGSAYDRFAAIGISRAASARTAVHSCSSWSG